MPSLPYPVPVHPAGWAAVRSRWRRAGLVRAHANSAPGWRPARPASLTPLLHLHPRPMPRSLVGQVRQGLPTGSLGSVGQLGSPVRPGSRDQAASLGRVESQVGLSRALVMLRVRQSRARVQGLGGQGGQPALRRHSRRLGYPRSLALYLVKRMRPASPRRRQSNPPLQAPGFLACLAKRASPHRGRPRLQFPGPGLLACPGRLRLPKWAPQQLANRPPRRNPPPLRLSNLRPNLALSLLPRQAHGWLGRDPVQARTANHRPLAPQEPDRSPSGKPVA